VRVVCQPFMGSFSATVGRWSVHPSWAASRQLRVPLARPSLARSAGAALQVFEQLDENHDGSLDKQELIKAFQMLNIKGGVNDVMRQADKDRDGRISFQEFCDLVTQGG
jgi:hypothetical protein